MSTESHTAAATAAPAHEAQGAWRFFVFSAIGIFMFFVPITIGDANTIPLDHLVSAIQDYAAPVVPFAILALVALGTARPFVTGSWRGSTTRTIFAVLNVVGLVVALLMITSSAPAWLAAEGLGPFLWDKLVIPVGLIVPIGAVFLALLVGYGLMEFVGVIVQPIMRPIFRTPGRSAVDAVASFVGSDSLGLLITNPSRARRAAPTDPGRGLRRRTRRDQPAHLDRGRPGRRPPRAPGRSDRSVRHHARRGGPAPRSGGGRGDRRASRGSGRHRPTARGEVTATVEPVTTCFSG
ncbi:hypothetical protein DUHN55_38980 [Helicobacter pylori]